MRQNTKLTLTIIALVGIIFWRETIHTIRANNYRTQIEYEIEDIKADFYNDGFNACMEQF